MKKERIAGILLSALLLAAMMVAGVFADSTYAKDSINDAKSSLAVPFSSTISGQITDDDKYDYYKVVLNESGRLSIDVHSDIEKLQIFLYDSNEDYTTVDYGMPAGDDTYTYDMVAGTYYLNFEKYNGTGMYRFSLDFTASGETYTQDNNTINAVRNGAAVPFGSTITGQIAYNDKYDYFKVVLNESGRLSIGVHSDLEKLQIFLYDSNENYTTVDYSMPTGDDTYIYDMAAGTYYLSFEKYNGTGTYRFTLDFTASGETYTQANNTINAVRNGSSIPLAKTINGQIAYNDDCDYFKVVLSKPLKLKIKVQSDIEKLGIFLYDSNENYTTVDYSMPRGAKTYTQDLAAGTYYLCFDKNSGTGTYSFSVSPSLSRPAFTSVVKGRKSIRLKWKKISGANGYVIQYARNKSFTKGKKQITIKSKRTVSKKIKRLKAKKKYYVRIRAYKTYEGKKYYSSWSRVRTVKTR